MHNTQSLIYLFIFIDHKLYILGDFLQFLLILCGRYMNKGQEGANVETCYEFGNKSNENVFQTQNKNEGDHRIKYIGIV